MMTLVTTTMARTRKITFLSTSPSLTWHSRRQGPQRSRALRVARVRPQKEVTSTTCARTAARFMLTSRASRTTRESTKGCTNSDARSATRVSTSATSWTCTWRATAATSPRCAQGVASSSHCVATGSGTREPARRKTRAWRKWCTSVHTVGKVAGGRATWPTTCLAHTMKGRSLIPAMFVLLVLTGGHLCAVTRANVRETAERRALRQYELRGWLAWKSCNYSSVKLDDVMGLGCIATCVPSKTKLQPPCLQQTVLP